MLCQVVAPHEALLTLVALESFVPCVRARVPLQLVAPREPLPTENPGADERPLPRVQSDVSAKQRRFPERFLTAGNVTDVLPLPHLPRPLVGVFAVGAGAGHPSLLLSWSWGQLQSQRLQLHRGLNRCELQRPSLHRLNRQVLLASRVGDGDRDALHLDSVDADGLNRLLWSWRQWGVQSDHASSDRSSGWSDFRQCSLLPHPTLSRLLIGRHW